MKITFLGTGSNGGIPQTDCDCNNCNFARIDPTRRRLRPSLLIEHERKNYIIDCTPDVKTQLEHINLRLQRLDGIIITHCHYDHIGGLPEIAVGGQHNISISCPNSIKKYLLNNFYFSYIFNLGYGRIDSHPVHPLKMEFVNVPHTKLFETFGVVIRCRHKTLGYFPDIGAIPSTLNKTLEECDIIIFDGTFINDSKLGHISVRESLELLPKRK